MSQAQEPARRRTQEEIIAALLSGMLDIGDLKMTVRVQVDEIDKSVDPPKLTRTRVYENGEQIEVMNY